MKFWLFVILAAVARAQSPCNVPEPLVDSILRGLDQMVPGHPKSGPLVMGIADRGEVVVVHLPSLTVTFGGKSQEMEGLAQYFPNHPWRWQGYALTLKFPRRPDLLTSFNQDISNSVACGPSAGSPTGAGSGLMVAQPSMQNKLDRLRREFPQCTMRPEPPVPRLCAPVPREAFCQVVRDWKDVPDFRETVLPPSPDSPLKRSMMQAIVRSIAWELVRDPGRNEILIDDFNVDDSHVWAYLLEPDGEYMGRFGVRLDKADPCIAEATLYGGGCTDCSRLDPKARAKMLRIYPPPR